MSRLISASTLRKFSTYLFIALATAVLFTLHPPVRDTLPFILFSAGTVFTAWFGSRGLWPLVLVLSWYTIDSLFLEPGDSLNVVLPKSYIAFAVFVVGLAISVLTGLMRT